LDRRPGLTFLKYRNPANWSHPDSVWSASIYINSLFI
jgi:hypothetical protein